MAVSISGNLFAPAEVSNCGLRSGTIKRRDVRVYRLNAGNAFTSWLLISCSTLALVLDIDSYISVNLVSSLFKTTYSWTRPAYVRSLKLFLLPRTLIAFPIAVTLLPYSVALCAT